MKVYEKSYIYTWFNYYSICFQEKEESWLIMRVRHSNYYGIVAN
jgi:hypothetical protein